MESDSFMAIPMNDQDSPKYYFPMLKPSWERNALHRFVLTSFTLKLEKNRFSLIKAQYDEN